jgi:hypothetical protein
VGNAKNHPVRYVILKLSIQELMRMEPGRVTSLCPYVRSDA